ncbi:MULTISPECIES: sensor histidine kinase [Dyella]|nr:MULTISPECIES: HAMP domain-containing sensor histidine kinase [Dyella]
MRRRLPSLQRRLFLDAVLPCALAALALVAALTFQVAHNQAERHDTQMELRIEHLASALAGGVIASPQPILDDAIRDDLLYIELHQADGRHWASGVTPTGTAVGTFRRELPSADGTMLALHVDVDLMPLRKAQTVTCLLGALCGIGVVLLTWLANGSLRRHLVLPLERVRTVLDDRMHERPPSTTVPVETEEFAQIRHTLAKLADRWKPRSAPASNGELDMQDTAELTRQTQGANRAKSRFIALVNHHFRQPLQALQLFTASLHPGFDTEQEQTISQMRHSIGSMTRLLDALLEISRLDAGVVGVKPVEFSAAELFLHDRTMLSEEAARRGVVLVWRGSHHRLHGDADLAATLLLHLASNAIANAPEGRVLIAARRRGNAIRIEVRDNGPGIAPDQQQNIFEEFVQLPATESQRRDGYGLGLAIGDRVARLLGTRIGLRSEPGYGSVFWFDLPQSPVAERRRTPRGVPGPTIWRHAG